MVTEALHDAGHLDWRVPYITEVIRGRPLPVRLAFVVMVTLIMHEHIEKMRLTYMVLPMLGRRAISPDLQMSPGIV